MMPRLNISFPLKRQWQYWLGKQYEPSEGEYLLNHARSGIVMALRASLPNGGRVGVVAYNCHTVANAVVNAGCTPVFVDVTEDLTIDVMSIPSDLDAIVVTNLFGIRNDIEAIRKRCPKAIVIVDNAHGYGLPAEGDFTVYSINQGKFPALGEGGILVVNSQQTNVKWEMSNDKREMKNGKCQMANDKWEMGNEKWEMGNEKWQMTNDKWQIKALYNSLPTYSFIAQFRLFISMLMKAIAYSRCMYWLTMKMKNSAHPNVHQKVVMKQMSPGVRRLYQAWLPNAQKEIEAQKRNAAALNVKLEAINNQCTTGANAFMAVVRCDNPAELQKWFAQRGVETATHFARAIAWATEFGYHPGSCPNAERLTKELLMIPTYR